MKDYANFYQNQSCQTFKNVDFVFFLNQTLPKALDPENPC